jgi:glutamate racemase
MEQIKRGPIGVFDSGYGGLTILRDMRRVLPQYDYVYLGDNARAPYGSRSFDVVYQFTRQSVRYLFDLGCPLVVLGCNTASAKALRTIQRQDLPQWEPGLRVLGVIRPTVESIGAVTRTRHVGILGTMGTIQSQSYPLELRKLFPDVVVTGHACPMWAPIVENNEYASPGADYFVRKDIESLLSADPLIDTVVLGCTHYPLLIDKIRQYMPPQIRIIAQGGIVADSLQRYLQRHADIQQRLAQDGRCEFLTTESPDKFRQSAAIFLNEEVTARHVDFGI